MLKFITIRKRVNQYSLFGRKPKDFFNNGDVWSWWISAQTPPTNREHGGGGVLTWTWAPHNHRVVHELHCITKWSLRGRLSVKSLAKLSHITWQESQAHHQICKRMFQSPNQSPGFNLTGIKRAACKQIHTAKLQWIEATLKKNGHYIVASESRTTSFQIRASS